MTETAPEPLEVVRNFVNTRAYDTYSDEIDTPERLAAWLVGHGLLPDRTEISDADHRRAIDLREAIRSLVIAHGEGTIDGEAIDALNRVAGDLRLAVGVDGHGRIELAAVGDGIATALAQVFMTLHVAMLDGSFDRLKACANDTCVWLFNDRSKNRSKKWCDMQTCGNAANARAYRRRQREQHDTC